VNSFPSCAAAENDVEELFNNNILTNIVNLVNTAKVIYSEAMGNGTWYPNFKVAKSLKDNLKKQQQLLKDSYRTLDHASTDARHHEKEWRDMSDRLNKFYSTQVGWWGSSFVHSVENTASSAANNVKNTAQSAVSNVQNAANSAVNDVQNAANQVAHTSQWIAQNVAGTVNNTCQNVWNDARNIASGASALGQAIWVNRNALLSELEAIKADLTAA